MITERSQQEAYNKATTLIAQAIEMLGDTKVEGWMAHTCLDNVYRHLFEAAEALMDIEPNLLGKELRRTLLMLLPAEIGKKYGETE